VRPTAQPTARPTATPTPRPVVIAVEARDFLFAPASLAAPAEVPFGIAFTNADAAIPHNVSIATQGGASVFAGTIITGPSSTTYVVPALAPGTYRVSCIVHPAMTAALTAG
jgi:plastocyanin